ncbi:MAG: 16S rRNA (adenine(1518)-N(6)/adenine(1519)-N(6))-dimethyltransferase RsmA, partial [Anaerolineales bacterium]|nr:16S rRNA (adenine(1518)-N(6)/adenine(1519)-N(6))-dimethyltransferase RsmA [Anaerolineales bacterium]
MSLAPLPIATLLRRYGIHPRKGLGQNFLHDENILAKIAAIAELSPNEEVLEIGPGVGNLTRHLARLAASVTAVELDVRLFPILQEVLSSYPNVRLVQGDILALNPADLVSSQEYVVVANIPYYITSAILRHLLEKPRRPRRMILTVQLEVAERICAQPGEMSLLALSVQVYGYPSIAGRIPAGAFYPPPKVDSAILRIEIAAEPFLAPSLIDDFFTLVRAGFSQKRKTLRNALAAGLNLPNASVEALLGAACIA